MVWAEPLFRKEQINSAGRMLVRSAREDWKKWGANEWQGYEHAVAIINNWRGSHAYPLNTFQMNLRKTSRRFEHHAVIAQRIKRLSSIRHKLDRFENMKLSQMQDLGGCRAILSSVGSVAKVMRYYQRESAMKHVLASTDDYVGTPKSSGYRGVHLVYRYFSDKNKAAYNGMKIEMQLRSKFMHAWATAVETVGMFSGQALKSSMGSEEWQRFFALMGSAIARREGTPLVPGTPGLLPELREELAEYASRLKVADRLREYSNALSAISNASPDAYFFLLQLDPRQGSLSVAGFRANESQLAEESYAEAERIAKDKDETDAVLVSVESVTALSKAYPNYFADTRLFVELMMQTIEGRRQRIRLPNIKFGKSQQLSLFS